MFVGLHSKIVLCKLLENPTSRAKNRKSVEDMTRFGYKMNRMGLCFNQSSHFSTKSSQLFDNIPVRTSID